jgi:hypothetical protein
MKRLINKEKKIKQELISYCQNRIKENGINTGYYQKIIDNLSK